MFAVAGALHPGIHYLVDRLLAIGDVFANANVDVTHALDAVDHGRAVAAGVVELLVPGHVASVNRRRLAQLGRQLERTEFFLLALAVVSDQECVDRRGDLKVGQATNAQESRRHGTHSQLSQVRSRSLHDFTLAETAWMPARRRASRQSSSPTSNIWQARGRYS